MYALFFKALTVILEFYEQRLARLSVTGAHHRSDFANEPEHGLTNDHL